MYPFVHFMADLHTIIAQHVQCVMKLLSLIRSTKVYTKKEIMLLKTEIT